MADAFQVLERRYIAVCAERDAYHRERDTAAELAGKWRAELESTLLKLDEYEHRAKLHMDRCRHDMERIVALEQQNEALASRLGAVEDELRHSVSVMSIVRSWLLENVRGSTHWENCEREHATCRAISQIGDVVERLNRLDLTAGVVERPEPLCGIKGCDLPRNHDGWCNLGPLSE